MNSAERVTTAPHSKSDTPERTAGLVVILAEWILRVVALLIPVVLDILRQGQKQRDERPNDKEPGEAEHDSP